MERPELENKNLRGFFLLTFAFSWTFWILDALALRGLTSISLPSAFMSLVGAFGPSLAAIVLTLIYAGRTGLRELLGRLLVWRVGIQWYIFVLLWPALLSLLATAIYILSGGPAPDFAYPPVLRNYPMPPEVKASISLLPLLVFVSLQQLLLSSPMGEEIGWRGYALPGLQKKYSALYASVVLGIIWAAWHLPKFFTLYPPSMSFGWFLLNLVANAIIFTSVYNNTKGSLLLALLFHTSLNVTDLFLSPSPVHPFIGLALQGGLILVILRIWGIGLGRADTRG